MPDPKIVEIDEAELLRLRRMEGTLGTMLKNPTAKKKLAGALKEINPDDPLAKEADKVDPVEERFAALEKQNSDLLKQIESDASKREREAKLGKIQADQDAAFAQLLSGTHPQLDGRWTQDGIDKVKKVMEEKGILDVAIAARWVESQTPPQVPVTPGMGSWNFMDLPSAQDGAQNDLAKLVEAKGENDSILRKMATEAISEVRGATTRR